MSSPIQGNKPFILPFNNGVSSTQQNTASTASPTTQPQTTQPNASSVFTDGFDATMSSSMSISPEGMSAELNAEAQLELEGGPFSLSVTGYAQAGTSQTSQGGMTTFTVEAEIGVQAEAGVETNIVSGTVEASAGGRASYEVTVPSSAAEGITSAEQAAAMLSPFQPENLPVGTNIMMHGETFVQTGMSVTFENIGRVFDVTISDSVERARGMSIGINKVDENTVRVTIGPTQAVSRAGGLEISAFGVSAGMTDTVSLGQQSARQVDFDISTPEGLAAYDQFLATGELPPNDPALGTSNAADVQIYTGEMTRELSLGVSLGEGTLSSDEVILTNYDDGRQEFEWTTTLGSASYTMSGTPNDPSTFTYSAELPNVNSGTVDGLSQVYGSNFSGNPQGTTVTLTFTAADADLLHADAQQWVSDYESGVLGVTPPPDYVAEMAAAGTGQEALNVLLNPTMSYDTTLIADRLNLLSTFNTGTPMAGQVQVQ
ncbi:hypothetical protein [Hyalangium sp.]|uniref:hypothetical protein n=1 Tax=Hyalangium sp. TaxID=2028555 RepID=UPI002D6C4D0F|nr:hypothetical protein [Hyalangium sp.]HYH95559.1 hypothetical protein [Hyalangium sp.]